VGANRGEFLLFVVRVVNVDLMVRPLAPRHTTVFNPRQRDANTSHQQSGAREA
jgi:hypothetical protein